MTGATGFIGGHLTRHLSDSKCNVVAWVRDYEKAKNSHYLKDVPIQKCSLTEPLLEKFNKNDMLIHCAWDHVNDPLSLKHLNDNYSNSLNFIKSAINQGIKKILVLGTCYEYGLYEGQVFSDSPVVPSTPYGESKNRLHQSLLSLKKEIKFDLIWARVFYVFGEGQPKNNVISLFDLALENNESSFNMSGGEQILDYSPVSEVVNQISHILFNYKEGTFNICSGKPISLKNFLENRMRERGKSIKLNLGFYSYRPYESKKLWGADPIINY